MAACSSGAPEIGTGAGAGGGAATLAGSGGDLAGGAGAFATGGSTELDLGGAPAVAEAGGGSSGGSTSVLTSLPPGFTGTDLGGYQLGASLTGGAAGEGGASESGGGAGMPQPSGNCGNVLLGVVRDFKGANEPGGHPDFEADFSGEDVTEKLVASDLGSDGKPSYASQCEAATPVRAASCPFGPQTTTQANFDEWYRDTPGVNEPFLLSIYLAPQPGGLFTFQSLYYFPLDNAGFGNSGVADDQMRHNFGFTTEIHTQFAYQGGETFQFEGDDDVWVFINGKLAVDLGGLHKKTLRKVSLDDAAVQLGVKKGKVYPLDLFHAERHTNQSTFRIDTNLSFVNCGTVEPIPVIPK